MPNALGASDSQLIGATTHLQSGFCAQSSSSQKVSKQLVSEALQSFTAQGLVSAPEAFQGFWSGSKTTTVQKQPLTSRWWDLASTSQSKELE